MTSHDAGGASRAILLNAVRGLIAEARSERATMSVDSPERPFYLGVEAAAEEVLQPELAVSRGEHWLDRHASAFRDGYLRTASELEHASIATETPLRIPLPIAPTR